MQYIKTLAEVKKDDLALAGGKGANLGALIDAGISVPAGFCITTAGYCRFVEHNHLQSHILKQVSKISTENPEELEGAAKKIHRFFETGHIPEDISTEISAAYSALSSQGRVSPTAAMAVRSSATAEDLPDLSFAGQQDTYLNVVGQDNLLNAVLRCWASLWTARAIGYRRRNNISQNEIALAVVVQQMVPSQVSGVLFTANPLTGKRSETVIDATLGLGEALVSGMVEPDHYVVDSTDMTILKKTLGAKALSVRGVEGGGTQVVNESSANIQALPDPVIVELSRLGVKMAQVFGSAQDVEWAWTDERLYILQSRPVTSLYPLPEGDALQPLEVYFAFSAWQGMLDPLSPIGQDVYTLVAACLIHHFGVKARAQDRQGLLSAGERLFVNITGIFCNPLGRQILSVFVEAIDPVSSSVIKALMDDARLELIHRPMSLKNRLLIVRVMAPVFYNVVYNLMWPERGRRRLENRIEMFLGQIKERFDKARNLNEIADALEESPKASPVMLMPYLIPGIAGGQVPFQLLFRFAENLPGGTNLVLELTRGLPHNVTTEMDLRLWSVSKAIHTDPLAYEHFMNKEAVELCTEYLERRLPPVAQEQIEEFLSIYGMRGVAEIDPLRVRWNEDPIHILQVLKSYLQTDEPSHAPDVVFMRGAEKARQAQEDLVEAIRHTRFGLIKARIAGIMANRVRELGGLRETPKYFIVRMLALMRQPLLEAGEKLVATGVLKEKNDIFFLHVGELRYLEAGELPDVGNLIARRRQTYQREMGRKRIPRILLSDGTTFYEGASTVSEDSDKVLSGSPVSAGVVEGIVRVVRDPHGTRLLPGEILVCPATDPAWTPLFLSAGGLIMEVGGMMTHGSVVAREYGIPAVVGVSQATTRLKSGQRVRVDGSNGQIVLLEEEKTPIMT